MIGCSAAATQLQRCCRRDGTSMQRPFSSGLPKTRLLAPDHGGLSGLIGCLHWRPIPIRRPTALLHSPDHSSPDARSRPLLSRGRQAPGLVARAGCHELLRLRPPKPRRHAYRPLPRCIPAVASEPLRRIGHPICQVPVIGSAPFSVQGTLAGSSPRNLRTTTISLRTTTQLPGASVNCSNDVPRRFPANARGDCEPRSLRRAGRCPPSIVSGRHAPR